MFLKEYHKNGVKKNIVLKGLLHFLLKHLKIILINLNIETDLYYI